MNRRLSGVAAAPGVAIAAPWIHRPPAEAADRVPLREAAAEAVRQLNAIADRVRAAGRADEAAIFGAQALLAEDPELLDLAVRRAEAGERASLAILAVGAEQAAVLAGLDDEVLAARAADVTDVAERIARIVRGQQLPELSTRSIAMAVDLPPSVTAELDATLLAGIALEAGSPTAHAAIMARALGIPAVVGVAGLLAAADGSGEVGVDGTAGEVVVDPTPADREALDEAAGRQRAQVAADELLRDRPLATRDGRRIVLGANIGRPAEAQAAIAAGAEAIGLFRTEFMFMGRTAAPSEEEQADAYAAVLRAFGQRPVVIRLLDVGGDKLLPYLHQAAEDNPFLGVRAIRLAIDNRDVLVEQLRSILTAGRRVESVPWIMAPMVGDLADVLLLRDLLEEAGAPQKGAPGAPTVGIMVEMPSTVALADQLARSVDFFSIGTNDLTQYLMAADRSNPALAFRQDPMHPAVLRSIRDVIAAARAAAIPVSVCGEMAGDPLGAVALAGLGIDELSMDQRSFGAVKRALASVTSERAASTVAAACDAPSAAEARALIETCVAAGEPAHA